MIARDAPVVRFVADRVKPASVRSQSLRSANVYLGANPPFKRSVFSNLRLSFTCISAHEIFLVVKDSGLPDQMQFGSTEAGINAQESTPKTLAAIDAQRPAEGPNAVAVATTADTPALASAAAGSALTASQTASLGAAAGKGSS